MEAQQTSGQLLHNLLLFGRLLRGLGMDINPGRMIDLAQALEHIQLGYRQDFYHACRSLLVHDRDDIPLFDEAFNRFWRAKGAGWFDMQMPNLAQVMDKDDVVVAPPSLSDPNDTPEPDSNNTREEEDEDLPQVIEVTQTYSTNERLGQKDFADLTAEEMATIKALISQMTWQLGRRMTRRQRPGRGPTFDMRRSLRRNLRYGGEMIEWPTRKRKDKPRPLVVIADISGSMERYTRLLLHFIYGLSEGLNEVVESFVFSTRLSYISRQLQYKDVDQAICRPMAPPSSWSSSR